MKCIEVAHIYGNQQIGNEQLHSLKLLNLFKNDSIRKVCLIDNYNTLLTSELEKDIKSIDQDIIVFYENDFVNQAISFFSNFKLRCEIFNNKKVYFYNQIPIYEEVEHSKKFYCHSLCVVWYLFRLGYFTNENSCITLINILHFKYQKTEAKALTLIEQLVGIEYKNKIEYIWLNDGEKNESL